MIRPPSNRSDILTTMTLTALDPDGPLTDLPPFPYDLDEIKETKTQFIMEEILM